MYVFIGTQRLGEKGLEKQTGVFADVGPGVLVGGMVLKKGVPRVSEVGGVRDRGIGMSEVEEQDDCSWRIHSRDFSGTGGERAFSC